MGAASVGFTHYRFGNKIYQKGSGRLFLVLELKPEQKPEQKLEELGPLSLTHQAYLTFIIDKDGQIASFDELAQLEGKHVNNNTVSKHIGKIKQRIGCDIENVPRQGYKLDSTPLMVDIKDFESKPSVALIPPMPSTASTPSLPHSSTPSLTPSSTPSLPHSPTTTAPNTAIFSPVFIGSVILFLLSLSIWLVNPVAQGQSVTDNQSTDFQNTYSRNISTAQHSLLSPDGRLQAFEQKRPLAQLTNLWINNLATGEKLALTAAKTGVEDKLVGFSKDSLSLLFSRTIYTVSNKKNHEKGHSSCSMNEIVFTQFNPIKYSEKHLSACKQATAQ